VSGSRVRGVVPRLIALADRPAGPVVLALFALLEGTVFPAPTEAMLIALTLARPRRAWWLAVLATGSSVVGGVIAYQLGAHFYVTVARPLLASYDLLGQVDAVARVYRENAGLALVSSGYTPIPYMLYTMLAGASELSLATFVLGSLAGRALKYAPLAALAYVFGPAVQRVLARVGWVAVMVVVAVVLLVLLVRR
jgi:membrane protein YqaA with SNARE-associated domain